MTLSTGVAMALAGLLLAPPESPAMSPGIGYTVSHIQREVAMPAEEAAMRETLAKASLAPRLPPPRSDMSRIQGSRRARGLHAAAAIAAQLAMVLAGVMAVRDQNRQIREEQRGQARPYRPYR